MLSLEHKTKTSTLILVASLMKSVLEHQLARQKHKCKIVTARITVTTHCEVVWDLRAKVKVI